MTDGLFKGMFGEEISLLFFFLLIIVLFGTKKY